MPLELLEKRKPMPRLKQKSKPKSKCKIAKPKKKLADKSSTPPSSRGTFLCRLCGRASKDDSTSISIFGQHRFRPCQTMSIQQAIDQLIGIQV